MNALRKEISTYIDNIPDRKLKVLQPLLRSMAEEDDFVIETDLTDEEKEIIAKGEAEYKKGGYLPFDFN